MLTSYNTFVMYHLAKRQLTCADGSTITLDLAPLHGVGGWELVAFSQEFLDQPKTFTYCHPVHGELEIIRPCDWRRRS